MSFVISAFRCHLFGPSVLTPPPAARSPEPRLAAAARAQARERAPAAAYA